jgi:hypothetical protein
MIRSPYILDINVCHPRFHVISGIIGSDRHVKERKFYYYIPLYTSSSTIVNSLSPVPHVCMSVIPFKGHEPAKVDV